MVAMNMNLPSITSLPRRFQKSVLDGVEVASLLRVTHVALHKLIKRKDLTPKGAAGERLEAMRFRVEDVLTYLNRPTPDKPPTAPPPAPLALVPAPEVPVEPFVQPALAEDDLISATEAREILDRSGTWFGYRVKEGLVPMIVQGDKQLYRRGDVLALKELDDEHSRQPMLGSPGPSGVGLALDKLRAENAALASENVNLTAQLLQKPQAAAASPPLSLKELLVLATQAAAKEHITEVHMVHQSSGKWTLRTERVVVTSSSEEL